jgi:hypothetical protein
MVKGVMAGFLLGSLVFGVYFYSLRGPIIEPDLKIGFCSDNHFTSSQMNFIERVFSRAYPSAKLEIQAFDQCENLPSDLKEGDFDIVIDSHARNYEGSPEAESALFNLSFALAGQNNLTSLSHKKIAIQKGMRPFLTELKAGNLIEYGNVALAIEDLNNRRIDGILHFNDWMMFASDWPDKERLKAAFIMTPFKLTKRVYFHGQELKERFDGSFKNLKNSPVYFYWLKKYGALGAANE